MSVPDFAHTATAEQNRLAKATALAAAARELGLGADALAVGTGNRRRVWKAAGLTRAPGSEATWLVVVDVLRADDDPAPRPRPRGCRSHPGRAARLYLGGWLCDQCSPWARAGHPCPAPAGGTPAVVARTRALADARRPPAPPVPDVTEPATGPATTTHQQHPIRRTRRARGP